VENVIPKSENFHPDWQLSPITVRLSPVNPKFHSPHRKLSPNTVRTVTRHTYTSENSHILQLKTSPQRVRTFTHYWQLSPTTVSETLTYSSGKHHPKEWELSSTFHLPQWDSHSRIRTFTHHIENSFLIRW